MVNKRNKWSLSLGCIGRDMCYTLVSLFLLTYLQFTGLVDTKQFVVLTVIIVLCRIWDAINDPMMGTIITNTKTKFGKYRPWVLIGALTNALVMVLMFTVRFNNGWVNVAFIGVMYLLWGMTFTMNDISYWDLLPALTSDKKERDSLTTSVAVFASLGAFISGGVVPILTPGRMVMAYRIISIVCALVFVGCQLLVFFGVHDNKDDSFIERKHEEEEDKQEKVTLKGMVKILISNNQLMVMAIVILLYSLGSAILNAFGQNFFYFKYGYITNDGTMSGGTMMTIFTVIYGVGTLISQAIYPALANKWKRKQLINFSIISLIIGYVIFFAMSIIPGLPKVVSFIILCIIGLFIFAGQGVFYLTMLVMLTNTIEYGEWKTGKNNAAITFTIRPFMVKLAGAIQYGIVALTLVICGLNVITNKVGDVETVLGMLQEGKLASISECITYLETNMGHSASTIYGFIDPVAGLSVDTLKAYSESLFQQATTGSVIGLTAVMCIVPICLFIIAWIVARKKYIIDEDKYNEIMMDLEKRKNENN